MVASPGGREVGRVSIRVLPDSSRFRRELHAALTAIEAAEKLRIDAEVNQASLIASARAAVRKTQAVTPDIHIGTEVDQASAESTGRSINGLVLAGLALGPALVPVGAAVVGAFAPLAGVFTAATAGATAFGIAAGPTLAAVTKARQAHAAAEASYNKQVTDAGRATALKQQQAAYAALTPLQRQLAVAIDAAAAAHREFAATLAEPVVAVFTQGLGLLTRILPLLEAPARAAAAAFTTLIGEASRYLTSPAGKQFVAFIAGQVGPALLTLGRVVGNVFAGIAGLLRGFEPLIAPVSGGLLRMSQSFARFGEGASTSPKFREFLDYLRKVGPKVAEFAGALAKALGRLLVALAPLGELVLDGFTEFLQGFNKVPVGVVTGFVVALSTLVGIVAAANAVLSVSAAITAVVAARAKLAAVATGLHVVATRLATSTTATFIGVKALELAAWARTAAVAVASAAATAASAVAMRVVAAATRAWAAVQWVLNAALAANPIGIVVLLLVALVAAVVLAWRNSETFRRIVTAAWEGIKVVVGEVVGFVIDLLRGWLSTWLTIAGGILKGAALAFSWVPGIGGKLKSANRAFERFRADTDKTLKGWADDARKWGDKGAKGVGDGVKAGTPAAVGSANALAARLDAANKKPADQARGHGLGVGRGVADGIRDSTPSATAAAKRLADKAASETEKAKDGTRESGLAAGRGFADGLSAALSWVAGAARSLARAAISGAEAQLEQRSPSKVFIRIGKLTGAGFVVGLLRSEQSITSTLDKIIEVVKDKAKKLGREVVTGIRDAIRAARPELLRLAREQEATFDAFKAIATDVRATGDVTGFGAVTAAEQRRLDQLQALMEKARDTGDDVGAARIEAQLAAATREAEKLTALDITATLAAKVRAARAFAARLLRLEQLGLNRQALADLAAAGVEQGGAAAKALAEGGRKAIQEVNRLQTQLGATSTRIARVGSAATYDAGANLARALARGFRSQAREIDEAARAIARRLQRAIRAELGIHSDSRVGITLGRFFGSGLATGVDRSAGLMVDAVERLGKALPDRVGQVRPGGRDPAGTTRQGHTVNIFEAAGQTDADAVLAALGRAEALFGVGV